MIDFVVSLSTNGQKIPSTVTIISQVYGSPLRILFNSHDKPDAATLLPLLADAVAGIMVIVVSVAAVITAGCLFSVIIGFSAVLTVMLRPSSSPSPSLAEILYCMYYADECIEPLPKVIVWSADDGHEEKEDRGQTTTTKLNDFHC